MSEEKKTRKIKESAVEEKPTEEVLEEKSKKTKKEVEEVSKEKEEKSKKTKKEEKNPYLNEIKDAIRNNALIFGKKEVFKILLKTEKAKKIIVAENCPALILDELKKVSGSVEIAVFPGSSMDLAVICKRPHPVLMLVIV